MRTYETIAVFNPTLQEEALKKEIKKFEAVLSGAGAQSISLDVWGRREIAYTVGRFKHGHFVRFSFEGQNAELVPTLQQHLRLNEQVIKFQTHRLNLPKRKFKGRINPKGISEWVSDDFSDDMDARY